MRTLGQQQLQEITLRNPKHAPKQLTQDSYSLFSAVGTGISWANVSLICKRFMFVVGDPSPIGCTVRKSEAAVGSVVL